MTFSKKKFLSFPVKKQHKKAGEYLRSLFNSRTIDFQYRQLETWLHLPQLEATPEAMSARFCLHMDAANVCLKEHHLLVTRYDTPCTTPYGSIGVYLDNLRSAHNVGSILRTVEAFRLGEVYFSPDTPSHTHPKVAKTAMGAAALVPCSQRPLDTLPRPLIALETHPNAPSVFDFPFPQACTLLIGNETYGLSKNTLERADHMIQIPLCGSKNSLNVSCAFAIVAGYISSALATHASSP